MTTSRASSVTRNHGGRLWSSRSDTRNPAGLGTEVFRYLDFSEVVGGASAACDRLPPQPAVYAFFRNIKLPALASADDFLASVVTAVSARAARNRTDKVGPLHNITLECRSELSERKAETLSTLVQTASFRAFLSKIIKTASLLQSPLYVGKAVSLQARIKQHLEPMSDLAVRLRDADLTVNGCTLAYALVDESPVPLDDPTLFLIEEVITRLCRPGFVSRIG